MSTNDLLKSLLNEAEDVSQTSHIPGTLPDAMDVEMDDVEEVHDLHALRSPQSQSLSQGRSALAETHSLLAGANGQNAKADKGWMDALSGATPQPTPSSPQPVPVPPKPASTTADDPFLSSFDNKGAPAANPNVKPASKSQPKPIPEQAPQSAPQPVTAQTAQTADAKQGQINQNLVGQLQQLDGKLNSDQTPASTPNQADVRQASYLVEASQTVIDAAHTVQHMGQNLQRATEETLNLKYELNQAIAQQNLAAATQAEPAEDNAPKSIWIFAVINLLLMIGGLGGFWWFGQQQLHQIQDQQQELTYSLEKSQYEFMDSWEQQMTTLATSVEQLGHIDSDALVQQIHQSFEASLDKVIGHQSKAARVTISMAGAASEDAETDPLEAPDSQPTPSSTTDNTHQDAVTVSDTTDDLMERMKHMMQQMLANYSQQPIGDIASGSTQEKIEQALRQIKALNEKLSDQAQRIQKMSTAIPKIQEKQSWHGSQLVKNQKLMQSIETQLQALQSSQLKIATQVKKQLEKANQLPYSYKSRDLTLPNNVIVR